jgi:hypothetical protein
MMGLSLRVRSVRWHRLFQDRRHINTMDQREPSASKFICKILWQKGRPHLHNARWWRKRKHPVLPVGTEKDENQAVVLAG